MTRIRKNHQLSSLIEAYLEENPDKQRPADERAELDKINKLTADVLRPTRKHERDYDDSDEYSSDGDDGGVVDVGCPSCNQPGMFVIMLCYHIQILLVINALIMMLKIMKFVIIVMACFHVESMDQHQANVCIVFIYFGR